MNVLENKELQPKTDVCRRCGKKYKLDWTLYNETGDDQLTPVRDYCPEHSDTGGDYK